METMALAPVDHTGGLQQNALHCVAQRKKEGEGEKKVKKRKMMARAPPASGGERTPALWYTKVILLQKKRQGGTTDDQAGVTPTLRPGPPQKNRRTRWKVSASWSAATQGNRQKSLA